MNDRRQFVWRSTYSSGHTALMPHRSSLPPESPNVPRPSLPLLVTLVPMSGNLIGATDAEGGHVFVRADATPAEIGAAILAGVRDVTGAWFPSHDGATAPVIPLPRTPEEQEGNRGLG